jgi:hypothetical protein
MATLTSDATFRPRPVKAARYSAAHQKIQIINGHKPELLECALNGEHVGSIVHA